MRTIPSALADANRNPKCRGANSTSETERRASDKVALDTHREAVVVVVDVADNLSPPSIEDDDDDAAAPPVCC